MEYITKVSDAQFLLIAPEFVVDIETDTDSPIKGYKEWGLSHNADITWISFYVGGHAPVVFNMDKSLDDYSQIVGFVQAVFNRTGYTVVGHNLVFDLRNLLSHYQCHIPLGSLAWDTLTMSVLLLMGDNFKDGISLKALAHKYRLYSSKEELEFAEMMKASRATLHTVEQDKVLRYVALDTEITWRLYDLQKSVIACTHQEHLMPHSVVNDGKISIVGSEVKDRKLNAFAATKHWSKLQELVNWEQRITRWAGNQAARGVRLDREYLERHRSQLMQEYGVAFDQIDAKIVETIGHDKLVQFAWLVWLNELLLYYTMSSRRRKPDWTKWVYSLDYLKSKDPNFEGMETYISSGDVQKCLTFLKNPAIEPAPVDFSSIDLHKWASENVVNWETDERLRAVRAKYFVDYFVPYYKAKDFIAPKKLTNKDVFQMMYMFIVMKFDFPTNVDIVSNTDLITPALKVLVEAGADLDYQDEAITNYGWSITGDSVKFYFPKDEKGKLLPDPFLTIIDHRTKINRVEEFERHALRDGRIHSIIARKTQTGRATSTTMNLQNIQMDDFKGYLVPDTDDRMFISIDISNAENWLLAMTFGDSELAKACASGDFHMQMTKIYWPELSAQLIAESRWDELGKLRKKSKFVTFGSAYGAGAKKIAKMVGTTEEEAKRLLANRDARFLNYSQGRDKLQKAVEQSWKDGYRPAFTTLWSGRRIAIPLELRTRRKMVEGKIVEEKRMELPAYKAINYLPQGGVGEIIWRSIVITSEDMEREGRDVYVSSQVHDELVVDVRPEEAFEIAQRIIETIATVIPDAALNRTLPKTRMLSEVGIENFHKWGYRGTEGYIYPLPSDKFVNRWGIHDLPEGAEEAPTWVCDLSKGETIEKEISRFLEKSDKNYLDDKEIKQEVTFTAPNQWNDLDKTFSTLWMTLQSLNEHRSLQQLTIDGQNKGLYDFANRMLVVQESVHKGQPAGSEYKQVWDKVKNVKAAADQLLKWYEQYAIEQEDKFIEKNTTF